MKPKGIPMWKQFNDWFESLDIGVVLAGSVIIAVIIVCILGFTGVIHPPSSIEIYEDTYNECLTHETMTAELCHEIALAEIGD